MNIVDTLIEIEIDPNNFLKIKETLERIGVAKFSNKTLYQSCHILHKRQKFYITHFKEMFLLDGKTAEITDEDIARRNSIACLLDQWGLLTIKNPSLIGDKLLPIENKQIKKLKIIPYKDKDNWNLVAKYTIGKKR